ncbi:MAG: hypothetical protein R3F43_04225 [bacterium]
MEVFAEGELAAPIQVTLPFDAGAVGRVDQGAGDVKVWARADAGWTLLEPTSTGEGGITIELEAPTVVAAGVRLAAQAPTCADCREAVAQHQIRPLASRASAQRGRRRGRPAGIGLRRASAPGRLARPAGTSGPRARSHRKTATAQRGLALTSVMPAPRSAGTASGPGWQRRQRPRPIGRGDAIRASRAWVP